MGVEVDEPARVPEENAQDRIAPGKVRHGEGFCTEEAGGQAAQPVIIEILERIIEIVENQVFPALLDLVLDEFPPYSSRWP